MKRSPVNIRPLLLVPKSENPKGISVFLSAMVRLAESGLFHCDDFIDHLLKRLLELRSPETPYYCWGYNFDWQSRNGFLPKFVPNIICTTFAGNALLDVCAKSPNTEYLNMAKSAGDYILDHLCKTSADNEIFFNYTPLENDKVHNANLLGAAFLSRLYSLTGDNKFLISASRATHYSTIRQHPDGSWSYGEDKTQQWIDNFHTGYNLCALRDIGIFLKTDEFEPHVERGFKFYHDHFFREDAAPKYFDDRTYPLDIHSVAQSIITLIALKDIAPDNIELANRVCKWAINNMWDNRGFFYYQLTPFYNNKISYMRWSQAWMLLALATLLKHSGIAV